MGDDEWEVPESDQQWVTKVGPIYWLIWCALYHRYFFIFHSCKKYL